MRTFEPCEIGSLEDWNQFSFLRAGMARELNFSPQIMTQTPQQTECNDQRNDPE